MGYEAFDIMSEGDIDLLNMVFDRHETVRKDFKDHEDRVSAFFIESNLKSYMDQLFRIFDKYYVEDLSELIKTKTIKLSVDHISEVYHKCSEPTQKVFNEFFEGLDYWFEKVKENA